MEPTRKIEKVGMRNLRMEDYDQLAKSFKRIYADSMYSGQKNRLRNSLLSSLRVRWLLSLMIRLWAVRSLSSSIIIW